MGIITAAVVGTICKELGKLLVSAATDSKAAATIAGELAGAAGKGIAEKVIPRLVAAYVEPVEGHPEFRHIPDNDREAVRLEVIDSIKPALTRAFLGSPPYKSKDVVDRLVVIRKHKGSPVGFSTDAMHLYQQALDAAVRAIIKVAESAPEWHTANAVEIHAKLDDLAESLTAAAESQSQILTVLDFVKQSVAYLTAKEFLDRRAFLEVYYRAIRTTLDRMELYGLDVQEGHPARSQRLSVAYIALNLTAKDASKDEGSRSWEKVLNTLEPGSNGRLLVRGDAGMGKSTLLRWAAIALASRRDDTLWHKMLDSPSGPVRVLALDGEQLHDESGHKWEHVNPWRGKVPLLVILRECADGKFPEPDSFPAFVNCAVGAPPAGFVRWLLDEGKALIMIDGLDEVPTGEPMKSVSKGITQHMDLYGNRGNLFIATSRPLVKDPAWIAKLNFREAIIAPMTDPERDALIHKWHSAVAAETADLKRRTEIEAMPADLIGQLNNRAEIARLAAVPLLCAMICAQSGPLGSKLPESEFAIISKLAEAMLWVRDRDRAVPKTGTAWDDLNEAKRLAVVAKLAHFLISEGKAAVPQEAAIQKVVDALRYAGLSPHDAQRDAPAILSRMSDRGGMIRAPEGGLVEFAHKTFCEFLSAYQFVEDQDTRFLGEHAPEPGPSNVCRFTAGVKNRKYTEELIGRVLDGTDSPEVRSIVALRMKLAAPTLDPSVQDRVNAIEANMIPPHSPAHAMAIAGLGDEIVWRLAVSPGLPARQQILNATTLSQMRSTKATAALAAYAPMAENLSLVELLCRGLNPLSIPLVRRGMTEPDDEHRPSLTDSIRIQITDAALIEWLRTDTGLTLVTALYLNNTKVGDAGAAALASKDTGLTALTTLDLGGTEIGDAGAAALASRDTGLAALTTLKLNGTQIGDTGAAALASRDTGLKALTSLSLWNTQVGDAAVAALASTDTGLEALTKLNLFSTKVSDAGVAVLASKNTGLKALARLYLGGTKFGDAGAAALASKDTGLTALTSLSLWNCRVSDVGATALAAKDTGLTTLTSLSLWRTQVGDRGAAALASKDTGLTVLTSLDLSETKVGDAGVAALASKDTGLTALTVLDLRATKVGDAGATALASKDTGLTGLTLLDLSETNVGDAGAAALSSKHMGLTALATLILFTTQVGDAGAAALASKDSGLKALTALNLINTQLTDTGAAAIRQNHPHIHVLH